VTPTPDPDVRPTDDFSGSVTHWVDELKSGSQTAAQRLWTRYFRQMLLYSRSRLWGSDRLMADEEDVAIAAFKSFCGRIGSNRATQIHDREELWSLLVGIMVRKAADQVKFEHRKKRGGGMVRDDEAVLDGFESPAPPPDLAAQLAEEFQHLLAQLPDPGLQSIAVLKLEGYSGEEIAKELGCGVRTVERKLMLIRRQWTEGRG
jgi:DNA-directed RNA polymerase specialized sigma24 family protein